MRTTTKDQFGKVLVSALIVAVSASSAFAYPPDNAAVLYYRAFLLYKPEDATKPALDDYRHGQVELNEEIEDYLARNAAIIDMVLEATRIEHCDWGLDYSQGVEVVLPPHHEIRDIFFLIAAEATMQADTGNYHKALDHCVCMYRMANHLNERPLICYLVGAAITAATDKCVIRFLSEMPPDAETLTWLRDELAAVDKQPFSVLPSLAWKREAGVLSMTPERVINVVQMGVDEGELKKQSLERTRTADARFYARNSAYWDNFMSRVQAAFALPYEAAQAEIQRLDQQPTAEFDRNPDATLTACLAPAFGQIHRVSVRLQAQSNAIRAAVNLYLSRARTGRLPETLPENALGDPFSGKPFEYEKANDHFTLRCRVKQTPEKAKPERYEFKFRP